MERAFRHTALASHYLILFALFIYFKAKKYGEPISPGYILLSAVSILIHPYFLPMILGILLADIIDNTAVRQKPFRSFIVFVASIGLTFTAGLCSGIFMLGESQRSSGY